jgi:menaquinol-cytochrome c reductase iron-sulfur subunit
MSYVPRRTVLGLLVTGGGMLVAGIIGIPALIAALSPILQKRMQKRMRENWRPLGPLIDFSVGSVSEAICSPEVGVWPRPFNKQAVFVWRPSEAEIVVFSRSCTDLGCALNHDTASGCYLCPCHGGIFDQDGQRLAGPPNRPMHRYAHRLRNGVLEINLASIPPSA